jgi:hypothetical protein
MPRWFLLVLVVVALAAAAWWWSGADSDERRIQGQVDRLLELAAKEPGEGALAGLERANAITGLFAAELEVRARPLGFHTRDRRALARAIQGYRASSERIRAQAEERRLQVDRESRRAILHLTARFSGGLALGGRETYRFQVNWVEQDGTWLIDHVDLLEVVP